MFEPAHLLESVVNSKADRSTETRDVENYNLMVTLRSGIFLGPGFGHEYVEAVKGDDIPRPSPSIGSFRTTATWACSRSAD